MTLLLIGLLLFVAVHSIRIAGDGPRAALIARVGEAPYKIAYSVLSLAGLVLIGRGYEQAYGDYGLLWSPPMGLSHLALLLVPAAFVLVVASYLPVGRIKRSVGHPMVLGVALWALGHLLANGETANVVVFGAFLLWASADYAGSLARDRREGTVRVAVSGRSDIIALVVGLAAALVFALWLHQLLIGVSPLG